MKNANFRNITAASIARYLIDKGWEKDFRFPNEKLMVFYHSEYKQQIALPASEQYRDFFYTFDEILKTLSTLEQREEREITKELLTKCFDRLEFRIISPDAIDGRLPLDYASECIDGLKDLILYSACAEQNTQPICWRATSTAMNTLSNFKLAQTEIGSFIINIDALVVDERQEQTTMGNVDVRPNLMRAFEHQVVERIGTAIRQIDEAVDNGISPSIFAETAYKKGITANMCEALLKLKPTATDTVVEARVKYSSAIPKATEDNISIALNDYHFLVAEELSKIYRNRELFRDVILRGHIKLLSRQSEGENVVKLFTVYEGQSKIIRMELSDDDHRKACDAYRDETEVEVVGELDMSERSWIITKVSQFSVLG